MKDYQEMTTQEIEDEMMSKEKEMKSMEATNEILELEDLRLAKEVAELTCKRKGIAPGLVQGKNNIKRIRHDLKTLEILKWRSIKNDKGL